MEGCGFRDLQADFDALGIQIVGVSYASIAELQNWADDQGFEYELWQDTDRALSLHYGAASSSTAWVPDRKTVVLDADGNHILSYTSIGFLPGGHPEDVLDDCEAIWGGR